MCVHTKGLPNVWAHFPGRWSSPGIFCRLPNSLVFFSLSLSDFCWPALTELISIHLSYSWIHPDAVDLLHGLRCDTAGAVWVSEDVGELQLHL